jgi:polysaccharide biosynthesis transport protein
MELKTYLAVLARRWTVVLLGAVVVICLAVLGSRSYSPKYQAVVMLRIVTPLVGSPDNINYQTTFATRVLNTYAQIAMSEQISNDLKKKLSLQILPDIKVDVIPDSEILQIVVESKDSELAAKTANELSNLLISYQDKAPHESNSELDILSARQKELQSQLTEYQQQHDQLVQDYSKTAADMTVMEGTIRLKEAAYQTLRYKVEIDQAEKELTTLNQQYAALSTKANEYLQQITLMRQMIQGIQTTYMNLLSQYDNVSLSTLRRENAQAIEVVSLATKPTVPSGPSKSLILILGVICGLIAGVAAAFTVDNLDTRILSMKQIQGLTKAPILGRISKFRKHKDIDKDPVTRRDYWLLFTQIQTVISSGSIKTIMVTSPRKGDGKSTVVKRLALELARNSFKVLVVDADLRKPQQYKLFNVTAESGLNDFLDNRINSPREAILKGLEPGLDLCPSLAEPDTPIELLQASRWEEVFEVCEGYDVVLFDTSALLASSDSLHLAKCVDGAIVIVQWGHTTIGDVQSTYDQLERVGSKILGLVVNKLPPKKLL